MNLSFFLRLECSPLNFVEIMFEFAIKKEMKAVSLALRQILHSISGYLLGLVNLEKYRALPLIFTRSYGSFICHDEYPHR